MFAGYLIYGLWFAFTIYLTVYCVESGYGVSRDGGKQIGLWMAGNITYGICVVAANWMLFHRLNLWDRWALGLYAFSVGTYFFVLFVQSQLMMFPKVFGSFDNAWVEQPVVWFGLLCVLLQTSGIELLYDLFKKSDDIFADKLRRDYEDERRSTAFRGSVVGEATVQIEGKRLLNAKHVAETMAAKAKHHKLNKREAGMVV